VPQRWGANLIDAGEATRRRCDAIARGKRAMEAGTMEKPQGTIEGDNRSHRARKVDA
jgi:hypothetical protein